MTTLKRNVENQRTHITNKRNGPSKREETLPSLADDIVRTSVLLIVELKTARTLLHVCTFNHFRLNVKYAMLRVEINKMDL